MEDLLPDFNITSVWKRLEKRETQSLSLSLSRSFGALWKERRVYVPQYQIIWILLKFLFILYKKNYWKKDETFLEIIVILDEQTSNYRIAFKKWKSINYISK